MIHALFNRKKNPNAFTVSPCQSNIFYLTFFSTLIALQILLYVGL